MDEVDFSSLLMGGDFESSAGTTTDEQTLVLKRDELPQKLLRRDDEPPFTEDELYFVRPHNYFLDVWQERTLRHSPWVSNL